MKIVFALMAALLVAACANLTEARPDQLTGEWRYIDAIQSCHYVFKKDATFTGEVTYQGVRLSQFKGRWSLQGNHLLYEYTGDALGRILPGTRDSDKLLAVGRDHFVIEAADGSKRRYLRVK